jgi:hypothetical protein
MKSKIINTVIDITAGLGIGLLALYIVILCIDEAIKGY